MRAGYRRRSRRHQKEAANCHLPLASFFVQRSIDENSRNKEEQIYSYSS